MALIPATKWTKRRRCASDEVWFPHHADLGQLWSSDGSRVLPSALWRTASLSLHLDPQSVGHHPRSLVSHILYPFENFDEYLLLRKFIIVIRPTTKITTFNVYNRHCAMWFSMLHRLLTCTFIVINICVYYIILLWRRDKLATINYVHKRHHED